MEPKSISKGDADGKHLATLKGDRIKEEFVEILEDCIQKKYQTS